MELKKQIIIKADYNDGDYITEQCSITDERLEKVKEIVAVLKEVNKRTRRIEWPTGDCAGRGESIYNYATDGHLTMEEIQFLDEYVPHGEHGVHTIESIEIVYQGEKIL